MKGIIIAVDDERIILDSLYIQLFREFGNDFIIELAESGEEALEILEEFEDSDEEVRIVISDWLMPNMKGDEFLLEVYKKMPKTNTILLTGQADKKAIENAYKNTNLKEVLSKPWDSKRLVEKVKSYLDNYC